MFRTKSLAAVACVALATTLSAQDNSANGAGFLLELNRIDDSTAGTCQMVFLGRNGLGSDLDEITLRLAVIDADGVFKNMLALPFGKLGDGKRRFAQYNIPTACSEISEIVVNDIAACKLAGSADDSEACLTSLSVSSRASIALGI